MSASKRGKAKFQARPNVEQRAEHRFRLKFCYSGCRLIFPEDPFLEFDAKPTVVRGAPAE